MGYKQIMKHGFNKCTQNRAEYLEKNSMVLLKNTYLHHNLIYVKGIIGTVIWELNMIFYFYIYHIKVSLSYLKECHPFFSETKYRRIWC